MYRSASSNRVWDDYLQYQSTSPPQSRTSASQRSLDSDELPSYESPPAMSKKDKSRAKFAENAVHAIPLVLLLCALVLWCFSNPNIQVPIRGDSVAARIEGMTLEGELDTDSTQTGVLAGIDLGDLDSAKTHQYHGASTSKNKKIYS